MNGDSEKGPGDKKIFHLDEAERLPVVLNSSPAAEVVKQIIEQILINERRRARIEFIQISVFFLVFFFAILGAGIWFARQLLVQLGEERRVTEQVWRTMAGGAESGPAVYIADKTTGLPDQAGIKTPPPLNREELARLEQNIKTVSELLETRPQNASASIRDMLQNQQNAIQALSARLNQGQIGAAAAPEETRPVDSTAGGSASGGFIAAPLAENLNLRMPIPSL